MTIPKILLIKVVLPQPFGPISAMHSPCLQDKLTLFKTLSLPKFFDKLLISIIILKSALMVYYQ
jgi:hypothetical protein